MKILILFASNLFPIKGMYQVRVFNQIKYLSRFHKIVFANMPTDQDSIEETAHKISPYVSEYLPIKSGLRSRSRLIRGLKKLVRAARYQFSRVSREEISLNTRSINREIINILGRDTYHVVIIHYWYWGYFFRETKPGILKILDTHYVVEENLELFDQGYYQVASRGRLKRELLHSLGRQYEYFGLCDLVMVNSKRQAEIIRQRSPGSNVVVAENGQDLEEYINYQYATDTNQVLFYGALSSQFNKLALERVLRSIFPGITAKIPAAKMLIVGSNPPLDIIGRFDGQNIEVTGFVEDIRPYVAPCALMLLPLETGSGFRGRAIEVMALGVPIVGTANGLQSLGIENGEQGFIADSDEEIIARSLSLMKDGKLREEISKKAREFVAKNYSLEATFGRLNQALCEAGKGLQEARSSKL